MKQNWILILLTAAICLIATLPSFGIEQTPRGVFDADFFNRAVFFGESTTTHIRSRSRIRSHQVWANASGTARLDSTLTQRPLCDPRDGSPVTLTDLASREQPDWMVLSFGLNGIMHFSENRDEYLACYQKLIGTISQASPVTRFVIQSVYPVAREEHQADWKFTEPPQAINQRIILLNGWLSDWCRPMKNAVFADTSCVLTDSDGYLRSDFTTDGIHLNEAAYTEILAALSQCKALQNDFRED